jgi:hypothetical protein
VTASSLGFARTFPLLTLLVALSLSALPICLQAQVARKFSWTYSYDPPGQRGREWTQLGPSKWVEVCQSGQRNTFTVTNRSATVAGNHGQIVERDDHALSVFIPNDNAQGKDPDWLRVWRRGDTKWGASCKVHRAQGLYLLDTLWLARLSERA